MGIRNLNRYLHEKCTTAITPHSLRDFAGKRIVIDTSIYLYRFVSENALVPQLYTMISVLLANQISPLFVFDGKAPPEKRELLRRRQLEKIESREKYESLCEYFQEAHTLMTEEEKETVQREMDVLKRQMTRVTEEHTKAAKELMDACGVPWIDADQESDHVCAYMVKTKKAWACMSDDMDMFVLGCTRVLRNFHLINQTVMYYSLPSILRELNLSMKDFRQITVISGTDYNVEKMDTTTTNLYETLKWFSEYRRMTVYGNCCIRDFYEWLNTYTKYIKNVETLQYTYRMFDFSEAEEYWKKYSSIRIQLKKPDIEKIRVMMNEHGVVFVS